MPWFVARSGRKVEVPVPTSASPRVVRVEVKLPADLAARLRAEATAEDRTISATVTRALRGYLPPVEGGDGHVTP